MYPCHEFERGSGRVHPSVQSNQRGYSHRGSPRWPWTLITIITPGLVRISTTYHIRDTSEQFAATFALHWLGRHVSDCRCLQVCTVDLEAPPHAHVPHLIDYIRFPLNYERPWLWGDRGTCHVGFRIIFAARELFREAPKWDKLERWFCNYGL